MEGSICAKCDHPAGESPRPCKKIRAPFLDDDDADVDMAAARRVPSIRTRRNTVD